jgi:hypothetical protein
MLIGTTVCVPNLAGYVWDSEKSSVLCKQMLAIYHEDLVAQGYVYWKAMRNDRSDKHQ